MFKINGLGRFGKNLKAGRLVEEFDWDRRSGIGRVEI